MPRMTKGCTYEFKKNGGTSVRVKLVGYDPVSKFHIVSKNGKESRLNMKSLNGLKAVRTSRKTDTTNVYLYMCDIGNNTYKLGATCSPERRQKQISTYAPRAAMKTVVRLPSEKGADWTKFEKKVLNQFASFRPSGGGREVVRLGQEDAARCATFMRSVASGA